MDPHFLLLAGHSTDKDPLLRVEQAAAVIDGVPGLDQPAVDAGEIGVVPGIAVDRI
jgi:hypothetical protein